MAGSSRTDRRQSPYNAATVTLHVLPIVVLPQIIDCMVLSHARHCIQVYGSASPMSRKNIQKILNFAARIISGCRKYDHISSALNQLGWLNAEGLVLYSDLRMLDKIIAIETPSSLASLIHFKHEFLCRDTRESNHVGLPPPRNNHGKRTFLYRAANFSTVVSLHVQNSTHNVTNR